MLFKKRNENLSYEWIGLSSDSDSSRKQPLVWSEKNRVVAKSGGQFAWPEVGGWRKG